MDGKHMKCETKIKPGTFTKHLHWKIQYVHFGLETRRVRERERAIIKRMKRNKATKKQQQQQISNFCLIIQSKIGSWAEINKIKTDRASERARERENEWRFFFWKGMNAKRIHSNHTYWGWIVRDCKNWLLLSQNILIILKYRKKRRNPERDIKTTTTL